MHTTRILNLLAATASLILGVNATAAPNKYRDEDREIWYAVPLKPKNIIKSQNLTKFLKEKKSLPAFGKKPENWPVRAIYSGPDGDFFEFDSTGRIVYDKSNPDKRYDPDSYVMRQIFTRGKPVWKNAKVFHKIRELDEKDPGYTAALVPVGIVRSKTGHFCPIRDIDPASHQIPSPIGIHTYEFDGTCDEAIEININNHVFLTYPGFKNINNPYIYWSIQYFSDPVTPIYNESGECLRYCDEEAQKQEALFRKPYSAR
ncbi:hypothetical protein [Ralstonia insidiosa]|uniref:Uncharacterized protein n=1 Tax=Ralstonia insidiosa TaxID=190721 RepID=A0A848P3Z0_9RALS|nr:hypothetical protein [Ralstonia insidiosa]NMV42012.1 hypothetical protein [Ralstonia insidiosa]